MTCAEMDDVRTRAGAVTNEALSGSVREHLRNCAACQSLQRVWESANPSTPEIPPELRERVLQGIVPGLGPVSPLPPDRTLAATLLVLAFAAIAVAVGWLGLDGWRALSPRQAAVVFAILAAAATVVSFVIARQMVPGSSQPVSSYAVMMGVCAALLAGSILLFPYSANPEFVTKGLPCLARGLLVSLGSGLLFIIVLRRGAWLRPLAQGAAAGLFSGLAGLTALELYCPLLDSAHKGVWHFGSVVLAILVGSLLAALSDALSRRRRKPVPIRP